MCKHTWRLCIRVTCHGNDSKDRKTKMPAAGPLRREITDEGICSTRRMNRVSQSLPFGKAEPGSSSPQNYAGNHRRPRTI